MEDFIISIFSASDTVWDALINGIAMQLFTAAPNEFAEGDLFQVAHAAYNAVADICIPIAVVFFLIAIIKTTISTPQDQQVHRVLHEGIKFAIIIGIIGNLWFIMKQVITVCNGIVENIGGASDIQLNCSDQISVLIDNGLLDKPDVEVHFFTLGQDLANLIGAWILYGILVVFLMLVGLITLVVIIKCSFDIIIIAFKRIIKPLIILPFAGISIAFGAGSGEIERVMIAYIKTFIGLCLMGAFMIVCVQLGVALMNSETVMGLFGFNDEINGLSDQYLTVLMLGIKNCLTPMVISGAIKGVDGLVARFL